MQGRGTRCTVGPGDDGIVYFGGNKQLNDGIGTQLMDGQQGRAHRYRRPSQS